MPYLTVQELSEGAYVSKSTIVRLCKKLGLKGYREFRVRFVAELQRIAPETGTGVDADFPMLASDSTFEITKKLYQLFEDSLADTYQKLDQGQPEQAVTLMAGARRLAVFAWGNNYPLALDFQNKMVKIGHDVVVNVLPGEEIHVVASLARQDCAVIISYSGSTAPARRVSEALRRSGVPTIAITGNPNSPIAKASSIVLANTNLEDYIVKFSTASSTIGAFLILTMLYDCLFMRDYQSNSRRRIETEKTYTSKNREEIGATRARRSSRGSSD